jgi:tyrosyl-tRNA synthetase
VPEDILGELEWRGLVAQSTDVDALRRDLESGPLTLYCGFDPTADSLHVGNLVPLLTLRRFQLAGHRPIALAGGATGMIGDPSGRATERSLASVEEIRGRITRLRPQLERFVDISGGLALLEDNISWTAPLSTIDFLRDVGKHFSVNVMLARESVSARLEGGGISFTEFSYMLLQAFDFLELYRRRRGTCASSTRPPSPRPSARPRTPAWDGRCRRSPSSWSPPAWTPAGPPRGAPSRRAAPT